MNLEQQVDEIELLQSMYSSPDEFQFHDQVAYDQAVAYTRQLCADPPRTISVKVFVLIDAHHDSATAESMSPRGATVQDVQYRLEIFFRLSNSYPDTPPEVNLFSNELHKSNQDEMNSDLQQYINTLPTGEPYMLSVTDWARSHAHQYFPIPITQSSVLKLDSDPTSKHFCRLWLYMHHIYSKTKRKNILSYASDLDLTGFCLPGKPGVVCVEGTKQNTREFYSILRSWNWKSITCRKREVDESWCDVAACRKISGFQELVLDMHGHRSNHMDMGQFFTYLREHKLEYMFKELFGVEGQSGE